jgi:hypothetical protein
MKKTLLLLTLVALLTSAGTIGTATSTKVKVVRIAAPDVPEPVMNTYSQLVNDIMTANFPANPNWDDSNIAWEKVRKEWHNSGRILQVGGTGSVQIISGRFQQSGEYIEVRYVVNQ